ncbi:MAG: DUF1957 domain-containing protein [Nitrospirae bacterium]|uniref:glycoside hydrolase family 57 protein n=1 Tax=Candidatus Magnetobacterium casense TaxID=1455061 RepID=UPI00058C6846|nr:1,4-alpha-glucan branching protein domain-containing protein [Candidatus Magnetobacterium casensis]MBF0337031.1 DUF1957 domain-containing protein [Nitrospirota bacterium]
MTQGYWLPVLHSHLPFVKHPEYDYFLEEHWLFEAITETYIPLLMIMQRMVDEGVGFRLTTSVTPTLAEMLADEYLGQRYMKHLDKLIELSERELKRLNNDRDFLPLALFYNQRFNEIKSFYVNVLNCNLLSGYGRFMDMGKLDVITCGATHGFLPLLSVNPQAIEVQIGVAVQTHTRHFGKAPSGIWLPECAYYEGLDEVLRRHSLQYFFLDTHGLTEGSPSPRYNVYAPVYTTHGVAAFARDPLSSQQVWSSKSGYPGDFDYRDFYKDIGYDLDFDYIKPYISPDGIRVFTGLKYYRVTGLADDKHPYIPEAALNKAILHAKDFCSKRDDHIRALSRGMDRPPAVVSCYDAELYGHWWFEGPEFLYHVFCQTHNDNAIKAITPLEYLCRFHDNQVVSPRPSTWGDKGGYDVWLNDKNDWVYKHLFSMATTMETLANAHYHESHPITVRVLNQLLRELLLSQSSDWTFLITMGTASQYCEKRTKEHIANFNRLLEGFRARRLDINFLQWLEQKNSIFEDLNFRVFACKR